MPGDLADGRAGTGFLAVRPDKGQDLLLASGQIAVHDLPDRVSAAKNLPDLHTQVLYHNRFGQGYHLLDDSWFTFRRLLSRWKADAYPGAPARLGEDFDPSTVLLDDAVHNGEAQAGSLAIPFVVKNGVKILSVFDCPVRGYSHTR
ncbi:MAG: hypothetical protein OHK006_15860 [Thermodesulfovibrionales bacterium]